MISIEKLSFDYKLDTESIKVLRGIDLEIEQGESVSIIGANGSGKTTLVLCLNGLLLPTEGQVEVDGLSTSRPENIPIIRRKVGMVFQNPDNQIVSTIVEREIAFGLENLGVPFDQMHRRVEEALERFDLVRYRYHPPHKLSGGEKQRLAFASVWAMQPRYLVLDEPTSLLDPKGCHEIMDTLRQLRTEENITVINVTQSPDEAAQADRIIVMSEGQIVLDGFPEEVFRQVATLQLLGLDIPFPLRLDRILSQRGINIINFPLSLNQLAQESDPSVDGSLSLKPLSLSALKAPKNERFITTEKLCHVYNKGLPTQKLALSEIDLSIEDGECIALIGPTGSGKSTLVQHFNGLLPATSGRVSVDGVDLRSRGIDLQKVRQKIGLVFQFPEFQLFEETVAKDVAFGPNNLGWSDEVVEKNVRAALKDVELDYEEFSSRSPLALSGGEKRRVAIAGILAMRPQALVLDEPTAGLDPKGKAQIVSILRTFRQEKGTVIFISHDMDLVAQLAERTLIMADGKVLFDGPTRQVLTQTDNLRALGLDLPQSTILARKLREIGWGVRYDALTLEEIEEEIVRILSSGKKA